ncbi:dentin sialophosphoprotein-like [Littorina saxatilis]|uniref:non-specific serine/threonine protein kinase n=1 Tax=Littorina saxatilis TaxID=31220 RepID=A0AAN9BUK4_9CAEN
MGKERVLRTYGHHRQRCVVSFETANIFESSGESRQHVFSTSSSESGIGPSDSIDSVDVSSHGRRAKNKALRSLKAGGEEKADTKTNKRKRQPRHATGRLFSSDKDTCSSSDCSTPAAKQATRRVLHDISNDGAKKEKPKRQPRKNPQKTKPVPAPKNHSSINFSEFDDYSLVISDSPLATGRGGKKNGGERGAGVGTSTPCHEVTRVKPSADLHTVDVSYIAPSNESVNATQSESPGFSVATPSCLAVCHESNASVFSDPSPWLCDSDSKDEEGDSEHRNLQRLEESFASMRVGRRLRKRYEHKEQNTESEQSSELSPIPYRQDSPEHDHVALECKNRVQKLKESLLRSSAGSTDVSQQEEFDGSCSLFDSPGHTELRSEKKTTLSHSAGGNVGSVEKASHSVIIISDSDNDCESDSRATDSEDLSAIVEGGEEEEEEDEWEDAEDDEEVDEEGGESYNSCETGGDQDSSDTEVNQSCSTLEPEGSPTGGDSDDNGNISLLLEESPKQGSPVRYMLTSITGDEDNDDDNEENGDDDGSPTGGDSDDNGNISLLLEESPKQGSPVRYMLTSMTGDEDNDDDNEENDDEEEEDGDDEDSSILDLSSRRSLGASHTRSFAEILTPSKKKSKELSPLDSVLQQCGQTEPLPFTSVIPASVLKKCVKVGEGVYGEVFRTKHKGHSVALKIIPIEGDFEVNDEPQKTFKEILPEIVISNELSCLREGDENNTSNFCPVKSVSLVQGRYPPELLKQWDVFHDKKKSENDRPDMFGDDQLYIMFEFGDGGSDLDGCKIQSAVQAVSVLQQVACALAVAEEVLLFEHRDLHVGNILVQPTQHDTVTITLNNTPVFVDTQGIHVSIIDFTLSRLAKDGCTVFCDLSCDDSLFKGKGDYQFDIYRMMKEENKNQWESYHPYTNVMWLHYLCDKLIHHKRFQATDRPHRDALKRLRQAYGNLLDYASAGHFVFGDSLFDS